MTRHFFESLFRHSLQLSSDEEEDEVVPEQPTEVDHDFEQEQFPTKRPTKVYTPISLR